MARLTGCAYSYCGASINHCSVDKGCQSNCDASTSGNLNRCGSEFGGKSYDGNLWGPCCSSSGYDSAQIDTNVFRANYDLRFCGDTEGHCLLANGCQLGCGPENVKKPEKGEKGDARPPGDAGIQGAQGEPGPPGLEGQPGLQGPQGVCPDCPRQIPPNVCGTHRVETYNGVHMAVWSSCSCWGQTSNIPRASSDSHCADICANDGSCRYARYDDDQKLCFIMGVPGRLSSTGDCFYGGLGSDHSALMKL